MEKTIIKVLFWHNHYPAHSQNDPYFGCGGTLHRLIEELAGKKLCWEFVGGFINENRDDFWQKAEKTDVLFCLPANMDYGDVLMHYDNAEKNLLDVIKKIKEKNPTIKIFFFEKEVHYFEKELTLQGEFIIDFHQKNENTIDKNVIEYFLKI